MSNVFLDFMRDAKIKRNLLFGGLWLAIFSVLFLIRPVLLPFILAFTLAYLLNPLVTYMSRFRVGKYSLHRIAALFVVYLLVFYFIYLFLVFIAPKLYKESSRFGHEVIVYLQEFDDAKIDQISDNIAGFIEEHHLPIQVVSDEQPHSSSMHKSGIITLDIAGLIRNFITHSVELLKLEVSHVASEVHHIIKKVLDGIFVFFLVLVITAFILSDFGRMRRFLFELVPQKYHGGFDKLLNKIDFGLSGVVRGQLIICMINGILTFIGLIALHVKFSFLLASIAGILSIIPIFGSILSTMPIVLVAATTSLSTALLAFVWILFIHALESNLLNPKILGKTSQIHPVIITLALIAGKYFYGVMGLLLAVPCASILLSIFYTVLSKARDLDEGVAKS